MFFSLTYLIFAIICRLAINMDNKDFLVIFDLDYTLWPFWVDTHITPPFRVKKKKDNGEKIIEDAYGFEIKLYPEVLQILEKAKTEKIKMGTVSRTLEPEYGKQLSYKLIYSRNKNKYLILKNISFHVNLIQELKQSQ